MIKIINIDDEIVMKIVMKVCVGGGGGGGESVLHAISAPPRGDPWAAVYVAG